MNYKQCQYSRFDLIETYVIFEPWSCGFGHCNSAHWRTIGIEFGINETESFGTWGIDAFVFTEQGDENPQKIWNQRRNLFFENKNFENKEKGIWVIFLRTRLTNRINSGDFEDEMSICGESSSLKFRRIDV